ncbi:MAG: aldo/keto reductase, partial [Sinomicrobium sp.]|nr:aldo/keto reductase [Sinomicrobium sp.]
MKHNTSFSGIIAGTMGWGSWGKQLSENGMVGLMRHCIANGITAFDHADIYGDYTTERDFGNAFAKSGIARTDIQLISKCGIQYVGNTRNNSVKHYNYAKDYIIGSAETSLKQLKTDYLDLLLLHRPSPLMQPDEIAGAVTALKKEGKIKAFGLSNFTPSQTALIRSRIPVSANQIRFSVTHFDPMLDGSLDDMMLHDILPMAWSPLGDVFKETNPQTERIKLLLLELVEKYRATADQLLLAWVLKHPSGIRPVIGTTDKARITHAAKASDVE